VGLYYARLCRVGPGGFITRLPAPPIAPGDMVLTGAFDGLHVVAEHSRARAEPGARLAKLLPSVSGCPRRVRGDRGERGISARKLVGPPVLPVAGAQGHAPCGEGIRERGVLAAAEHPPSADGLIVIAAASGEDGPEPTSATGRAGARHAP
jgi:hypothetical protein